MQTEGKGGRSCQGKTSLKGKSNHYVLQFSYVTCGLHIGCLLTILFSAIFVYLFVCMASLVVLPAKIVCCWLGYFIAIKGAKMFTKWAPKCYRFSKFVMFYILFWLMSMMLDGQGLLGGKGYTLSL